MPRRRRYGALQKRVSGGLLEAAWDAAGGARAGQRSQARPVGQPVRARGELGGGSRAGTLAERKAARSGRAERAAGMETANLREVREQQGKPYTGRPASDSFQ